MTHDDAPNHPGDRRDSKHLRIVLALGAVTVGTIAAAIVWAESTFPDGAVPQRPTDALVEAPSHLTLDHSVVNSQSLADDQDLTGASVAAYER